MRLSLCAVAALSVCSLAAHADTLSTSFTTGPFLTPPYAHPDVNPVTFSGFDPSMGTLTAVAVSLAGSYQVDMTGLNNPGFGNSDLAIFLNDSALGSNTEDMYTLLPQAEQPEDSTGIFNITASATDTSASQLAYFSNAGPLIAYFGAADGLDAVDTNATPDGLTGTVTYNYTPAITPTSTTPEPSSFALLGTGILGLAGAVRRRLA